MASSSSNHQFVYIQAIQDVSDAGTKFGAESLKDAVFGWAGGNQMFNKLEIVLQPVRLNTGEEWVEDEKSRYKLVMTSTQSIGHARFADMACRSSQSYKGFIRYTSWKCQEQCLRKLEKQFLPDLKSLKEGIIGPLAYVQQFLMRHMFALCHEHLIECGKFRQTGIRNEIPKRLCTALKFYLRAESQWQSDMFEKLEHDQALKTGASYHKMLLNTYHMRAGSFRDGQEQYMEELKTRYALLKDKDLGLDLSGELTFDLQNDKYTKVEYKAHTCGLCKVQQTKK